MRKADVERLLAGSPLQRLWFARTRRRLVVLAYHGIDDPAAFAAHLDWLGRHTSLVSLGQVSEHVTGAVPLPPHPVLLTFDDGERSILEHGLPLLRQHRAPGVVFAVAGVVGTSTPFWWREVEELAGQDAATAAPTAQVVRELKAVPDRERRARIERMRESGSAAFSMPQLTAAELRELEAHGVDVGDHTLTHPCLDRCDDETLEHELTESRRLLTEMLGHPPVAFAYPNGNVDERVRSAVERAGHRLAFGFDHRVAQTGGDPLRVSRVRCNSTDTVDRLKLLVSGLHPALHALRGRS